QPLMQSDGIHPNADGVARIVADLGPSVQVLIDRADSAPTQ
ncbi:MAG: arylesterase, partial [Pseudomonadota bacterium]